MCQRNLTSYLLYQVYLSLHDHESRYDIPQFDQQKAPSVCTTHIAGLQSRAKMTASVDDVYLFFNSSKKGFCFPYS